MNKVADVVWMATALLHQQHPDSADFSVADIIAKAEEVFGDRRPGIRAHASWHCVASKSADPGQYLMLHETTRGRRRLFRAGDPVHPDRHGKSIPRKEDLPPGFQGLVDWYLTEYTRDDRPQAPQRSASPDTFLTFIGLIPAYDLQQMTEAITEAFEQVEAEEHEGAA